MHAFRALQYCIDLADPSLNVMRDTEETVPPVADEFWAYAIDAPPPSWIQDEMTRIFPEWVRALESNMPLMEEGPTQVDTQGGVDPDSVDVARLLRDLDSRGGSVLEARVDEAVFGHPIAKDVAQAVRLAAMYDLYLGYRLGAQPVEPAPRRFWRVPGPEWIVLGLQLGTVAAQSATDVLRTRARRKRRLTVSELAELIKKSERA